MKKSELLTRLMRGGGGGLEGEIHCDYAMTGACQHPLLTQLQHGMCSS